MDLDRYADDLRDTPIGDLELKWMPPGDWVGVCIQPGPGKPPRCIHTVGSCIWDAVYGKRKFELPSVRKLYERRDEVRRLSLSSEFADQRRDLGSDFHRWLNRHGDDARDILHATMVR